MGLGSVCGAIAGSARLKLRFGFATGVVGLALAIASAGYSTPAFGKSEADHEDAIDAVAEKFESLAPEAREALGLSTQSLTSVLQAEQFAQKTVAQMLAKTQDGAVFTKVVLNHIGTGKPQELYTLLIAMRRLLDRHPELKKVKVVYNWINLEDFDAATHEVLESLDDRAKFGEVMLTYKDDPIYRNAPDQSGLRQQIQKITAKMRLGFGIPGGLSWVGLFGYARPARDRAADLAFSSLQTVLSSWILFHTLSQDALRGVDVNVLLPVAVNFGFSFYYAYNSAGNTHFKSQAKYVSTKVGSDPRLTPDERASQMYKRDLKVLLLKGLFDSVLMRMAILVTQNWTDQGMNLQSSAVWDTLATSLWGVPAKMPVDMINAHVQERYPKAAVWVRTGFGIFYSAVQIYSQLGSTWARTFLIAAGTTGIIVETIKKHKSLRHKLNRVARRIRGVPPNPAHCVTIFMPELEINDEVVSGGES